MCIQWTRCCWNWHKQTPVYFFLLTTRQCMHSKLKRKDGKLVPGGLTWSIWLTVRHSYYRWCNVRFFKEAAIFSCPCSINSYIHTSTIIHIIGHSSDHVILLKNKHFFCSDIVINGCHSDCMTIYLDKFIIVLQRLCGANLIKCMQKANKTIRW